MSGESFTHRLIYNPSVYILLKYFNLVNAIVEGEFMRAINVTELRYEADCFHCGRLLMRGGS